MLEHREYVDWEHGQLHIRQWGEYNDKKPSIFCLPPSPFSSIAYKTLARLLADEHHVISMDYPGFGNSTAMQDWPTIPDYAKATLTVVDSVSPDHPVVFLGFHSGTLVSSEASLLAPDKIDQLILIDIPFFDDQKRLTYLADKGGETPITTDMAMLEPLWKLCVESREGLIPLNRAYENFLDMIGGGERQNATYRAAFSYDCQGALAKLTAPTTFIATNAGLFEETKQAAAAVTNAKLVTLPQIDKAVLDVGADAVANAVDDILR